MFPKYLRSITGDVHIECNLSVIVQVRSISHKFGNTCGNYILLFHDGKEDLRKKTQANMAINNRFTTQDSGRWGQ